MHIEVIARLPQFNPRPTPLLSVHGAWHGAWCWAEHFLDTFADHGYASYALDLRGHGRSQGFAGLRWTPIAHYVADLARIARELPAAPVVIGHSMGGLVVQKYLEQQPAPAAVLLASVPPAGVARATLRYAARHPLALLKAGVRLHMYEFVSAPELTRDAFFSPATAPDLAYRTFPRIQGESLRAFLDMLALDLPRPLRVSTPVLVLGAADDRLFPPADVEATARAYNTRPVIFPDMGHDKMLEPGWPAVADYIVRWLRERGI
jgi:pimeloyl-ACP methyl ester carboxylesterase